MASSSQFTGPLRLVTGGVLFLAVGVSATMSDRTDNLWLWAGVGVALVGLVFVVSHAANVRWNPAYVPRFRARKSR